LGETKKKIRIREHCRQRKKNKDKNLKS